MMHAAWPASPVVSRRVQLPCTSASSKQRTTAALHPRIHTRPCAADRSVKAGGPDPVANAKLSDLLKQAKDLGVPKDIIERNIKKASDAKQGDFQECIYEAYGPGGTGFVIEALTDNVNRTAGGCTMMQLLAVAYAGSCGSTSARPACCWRRAGDVKSAITKGGGKPADSGSVMFNFMRQVRRAGPRRSGNACSGREKRSLAPAHAGLLRHSHTHRHTHWCCMAVVVAAAAACRARSW